MIETDEPKKQPNEMVHGWENNKKIKGEKGQQPKKADEKNFNL